MRNEWSLRDEILTLTHRWYLIAAFILAGCLAGFAVSRIWPSPHKATTELAVTLNIYQWDQDQNAINFAGNIEFSNPDDYKNWQMANLNVLVMSDEVVREALNRLRILDPYWASVSRNDLGDILHVYWRNAGRWRLVAEDTNTKHAVQAVTAWRDVILDSIGNAVQQSQNTMIQDQRMQSLSTKEAELKAHLGKLNGLNAQLKDWQTQAAGWSVSQPVNGMTRWQVLSGVTGAASFDPMWKALLDAAPSTQALPADYQSWMQQSRTTLDQEIQSTQDQVQLIEIERSQVANLYAIASKKSKGFSANMTVEKISNESPAVSANRPTSILMVVGGVLGLIVLVLLWIARLSRMARK